MKSLLICAVVMTVAVTSNGQENALDKYLAGAGTIVIAKCVSVGPVNILMRADTRVQVLHVVKGKETLRELVVNSHYPMSAGQSYLLKTKGVPSEGEKYFTTDTRDSVIPFYEEDRLGELKSLSPRIMVLRTMNIEADRLDSRIRSMQYELDALNAVRKGN